MFEFSEPMNDVYVYNAKFYDDQRGKFVKDYVQKDFAKITNFKKIQEIFYTISSKHVLRGLHFQYPKPQSKIIRCLKGKIFDVVVDLRFDSENFGKHFSIELSEFNNLAIIIPKGFAHGYYVIEDSIVSYKCDEVFFENFDDGIRYDDPNLSIDWPINNFLGLPILSKKDMELQSIDEFKLRYKNQ